MAFPEETRSRLLAKLIRDLLRVDTFDTLADLADALKYRCAALKIPWTPGDITDAFALIETNTPLTRQRLPSRPVEPTPEPVIGDRATDARIVRQLLERYHAEHDEITNPLRDVAPVRELSAEQILRRQFAADKRKALQLVLDEVAATAARADALEAALVPVAPEDEAS